MRSSTGVTMTDRSCIACGGRELEPVLSLPALPVFCNVLASHADDARRSPLADMDLALCLGCGLLLNTAADEALLAYSPGYENSLHHSPTFSRWADALAERLVREHDLHRGTAVELGCGDGGFLSLLVEHGIDSATGFDPSRHPDTACGGRVEIRSGILRPGSDVRADLAVCRHVLEHTMDPGGLLAVLAEVAPDGVVYLEVPDASHMLRTTGVLDLIYEHCGYYSEGALVALLSRHGLRPCRLEAEFGGQYLAVDAAPGATDPSGAGPAAELLDLAGSFAERAWSLLDRWAELLGASAERGDDVVLWGAGSKGITFVNLVEGASAVSRLVDLNPAKHGRFAPGSAHEIVSPASLAAVPPDVVVVPNPLYCAEVGAQLERLGIEASVVAL